MRSAWLVVASCGLLAAAAPVSADGGDTFLGYRWGALFHEPTVEPAVTKSIVSVTHSSRYRFGSNFANVDVFMSDRNDPANGAGSGGAQEIYLTYRHQLNLHRALKAPVKRGIVRDVSLTGGFDFNTKDTAFAPRKRAIAFGPTVNFEIPGGFLDLGVWLYKEWNHNAFGIEKDVSFDATYMINVTWGIPIGLGGVASVFKGFGYRVGSRGLDGVLVKTVPEELVRASWMFDVGAAVHLGKGRLLAGPGLEFWHHKFGNPSPIPAGVLTRPNRTTTCPTVQLEVHF